MTRRGFIGRGLAVGTAIALGRRAAVREKKYGRITAGQYPYGSIRCFIDGREITNCAFEANDREGWAKVWKTKRGYIMRNSDGPISETLYGSVRFEIA